MNKRRIATVFVHSIIIVAFILVGAGILGWVPDYPTFWIVIGLVLVGFVGECTLDALKRRIPPFPGDWINPVE